MPKTFRRNRRYRKKTVAKRRKANRSNKKSRNTFFGIKIGGAEIKAEMFLKEGIHFINNVTFNDITYKKIDVNVVKESKMVSNLVIGKKYINLQRSDEADEMFNMIIDFNVGILSLSDNARSLDINNLKNYRYDINDNNFEINKETSDGYNNNYTFKLKPNAIDLNSSILGPGDDELKAP